MAFRVLAGLAVICALVAITMFSLGAFSYVIAVALTAVFSLGAVVTRRLKPSGREARQL